MASYQKYSKGAYFHHGVDLLAAAGTAVLSSTAGRVTNIRNYVAGDPRYWEVAIRDPSGFLWQYHHVKRESISDDIFDALDSQNTIPARTKLGEIFPWDKHDFHHIHLNVLDRKERSRIHQPDQLHPIPTGLR